MTGFQTRGVLLHWANIYEHSLIRELPSAITAEEGFRLGGASLSR